MGHGAQSDGIDGDRVAAVLAREGLGEPGNGSLRTRIHRHVGLADAARFAPRLLQHIGELERLAKEQPSGVNGAIAHDARFRDKLARVRLEAEALEVTELRILAELAKGRAPGPQTSLVKLLGSNIGQQVDVLRLELLGPDALQLPLERPLYGNEAPEPVGSEYAQTAMGKYLNNRASTIFGGSDEVQKNIIAKTVLGL